jgi:putative alpha-1,2-mannosidase
MGVDIQELYSALASDAFTNAKEWNNGGRQIAVYEKYGYIPFAVYDTETVGRQTREASRTLEYANNDFGIRNVALLLGKKDDSNKLTKRALYWKNVFDSKTKSMGFNTFVQKRYTNGTFASVDPITCSPIDPDNHPCSLQQENVYGIYETSSWEYSLFVPFDTAGLIHLLSDGNKKEFVKRVDKFFDAQLFYSGNEPSFQAPVLYHYANEPAKSVDRVRHLVFQDFNTTASGLPGNDDNAAMATLLLFHLFGLYPVPSTREFLIVSPFLPSYTLTNSQLGTVTVTAKDFDKRSLKKMIPSGARAYVKSVSINGVKQSSRCKILFEQLFPGGQKHTDIVFEMATKDQVTDCGSSDEDLPSSMSTGGFDLF